MAIVMKTEESVSVQGVDAVKILEPAQNPQSRIRLSRGAAWVMLCLAFLVHVIDEVLTDFLSVYNPAAEVIRRRFPFLPLPTFTFESWLTILLVAVVILFTLSPLVFQGRPWTKASSFFFGFIMLANGVFHLMGSMYSGRALPGVYSSPLLLVASANLLLLHIGFGSRRSSANGNRKGGSWS